MVFHQFMHQHYSSPVLACDNVFTLCVCFFLCVCVSVYVCHDAWPYDLVMKDWRHTNNILSVYNWGCLVVQVMFHALVTSSMTSPGHKVSQIWKLIYLRHYFSYKVDQKLKISEMLMAILLVYSTSVIASGKKFVATLKWEPFWKFWNMKRSFTLTSNMKRSSKTLCQKKYFSWLLSSMTSRVGLKFAPLYSCLGEALPGRKWQGQCFVNTWEYCNGLSMLYMPKEDLNR